MATSNGELKEILGRIDQKLDDNIASVEKRLSALEGDMWGNGKPGVKADVAGLKNGVKVALGVLSTLLVISGLITACNAGALGAHEVHDATAIRVIQVTLSDEETPTPTAYPTFTPTATATIPADFPPADFPLFVSPTPVFRGTATPLAPIVEVTAISHEPTQGWFTPDAAMNVRLCAATTCGIVRRINGGERIMFYSIVKLDNGDLWLCLDPAIPCNTYVALIISGFVYGHWEPE